MIYRSLAIAAALLVLGPIAHAQDATTASIAPDNSFAGPGVRAAANVGDLLAQHYAPAGNTGLPWADSRTVSIGPAPSHEIAAAGVVDTAAILASVGVPSRAALVGGPDTSLGNPGVYPGARMSRVPGIVASRD